MRLAYDGRQAATDDIIYESARQRLAFTIGDVRDYSAVRQAVLEADIVFHAAALKQVPTCEYFPVEAVHTNVGGAENIVRAIREGGTAVELMVGISTDKACKPVNVMGMTKALQERILIEANRDIPDTRFICVRYGNVVASRGSIVPLFMEQIERGGPVTVTVKEMTRFMIGLEQAVDTIFDAMNQALPGQTYVPRIPSCRVVDIARVLMHGKDIPVTYTGIRPGEKIHEILVSEEECARTFAHNGYYVIDPALPELRAERQAQDALKEEYSSADAVLSLKEVDELFVGFDSAQTPEASL
jgi:UDP-glucose 4-epimerase